MTHGEQTKAKKTSQASGKQKTSSQTGGKAVQGGKTGKEASKAAKIVVKKDQTGPEKGSAAAQKGSAAKETGNGGKGKARPAAPDAVPGFSNPTVANAFKRAVKKYPNAFRKLTD